MSRLQELFKKKNNQVLNVYCTAGFPQPGDTLNVIHSLQEFGADIAEIGMPYSDPLADGPVIQESSNKAIANGMTIAKLFEQLKDLRNTIHIPVVLMGYMNPVMQYGFERFCRDAAEVGVDGFILPDMPMYEYEKNYGAILKRYQLDLIMLVTPETSEARIRQIDEASSGFLYAVSSSSTTGKSKQLTEQDGYFARLREMNLKNPVLIGFGIRDRETFEHACKFANGAIIGTAFIQALQGKASVEEATREFLKEVIGDKKQLSSNIK